MENITNLKTRDQTVDVLRGIGIVLMIMGHIGFGTKFDLWIHAFHMPMFYIISGYFFKKEIVKTDYFISKKSKELLLPYFSFALIGIFVAYTMGGAQGLIFWSAVRNILFSPNQGMPPSDPAIWFLVVLFWINVMFHYLHKWFGKNNGVLFTVCMLIGFAGMYLIKREQVILPLGLDAAFVGLAFMSTGYLFKEYMEKKYWKKILNMPIIIFLILGVFNIILIFFNGTANFRAGIYNNLFLNWFNAVLATVLLWNLSKWITKLSNKIRLVKIPAEGVAEIGKHSIIFLAMNQILLEVLAPEWNKLLRTNWYWNNCVGIMKLVSICFVCFVITAIVENTSLKKLIGH